MHRRCIHLAFETKLHYHTLATHVVFTHHRKPGKVIKNHSKKLYKKSSTPNRNVTSFRNLKKKASSLPHDVFPIAHTGKNTRTWGQSFPILMLFVCCFGPTIQTIVDVSDLWDISGPLKDIWRNDWRPLPAEVHKSSRFLTPRKRHNLSPPTNTFPLLYRDDAQRVLYGRINTSEGVKKSEGHIFYFIAI